MSSSADMGETTLPNGTKTGLTNETKTSPTNETDSYSLNNLAIALPDMNETLSSENHKRKNYLIWDDYFMAMALLSAQRSKDPVTQVGACIVDKHNRIVAIGYNGFPRNCSDDIFPWSKNIGDSMENKKLYVVHAEANAILNSNSTTLVDTCLYTTLFPCNECAKLIIQSGIRKVLYISDKYAHKAIYRAAKCMFDAVGIIYSQYKPNQRQIIINFDDI